MPEVWVEVPVEHRSRLAHRCRANALGAGEPRLEIADPGVDSEVAPGPDVGARRAVRIESSFVSSRELLGVPERDATIAGEARGGRWLACCRGSGVTVPKSRVR